MAYNPTTWKDQIATDPTKYKITKENGTEELVNIQKVPGEIIQEGTRITAEKLNNMEQGIKGAADLVGDLAGIGRTEETVKKNAEDIGRVSALMAKLETDKLDKISYTSSDILFKLKNVDGSGSGLDADKLDGKHASSYTNVITGSYLGNRSSRTINMGFRPKLVIVFTEHTHAGAANTYTVEPYIYFLKDGLFNMETGGIGHIQIDSSGLSVQKATTRAPKIVNSGIALKATTYADGMNQQYIRYHWTAFK
jgi:hypothetical protein